MAEKRGKKGDFSSARSPANRLIDEKSPYLLQHAHNPVDWFPWGEAAFDRARREGKLIFLSIGYSTCHWCHVMARESFEDDKAAEILNRSYVAVKVDREERPDIDQVYMEICMGLTGSGGWPLTIIMTADGYPLFAGTYLPRQPALGQPGLITLLEQLAHLWQENPDELCSRAESLVAALKRTGQAAGVEELSIPDLVRQAEAELRQSFDPRHGGFGAAPKFPTPHTLTFLLRRYRKSGEPELLAMAEQTLRALRDGGIYDQLGFGFHRYATDAAWRLPHFEKMLYDQAGLALAYLEGFQATGDGAYAATAREIFTYVLRDLTGPEGAFYAGEDAETEGVEGKFYLWSEAEVEKELGEEEGALVARAFGLRPGGGEKTLPAEKNTPKTLHRPDTWEHLAREVGLGDERLRERLEQGRLRLLMRRGTRIRPHRDDKIITAWNGLMISALARGGHLLAEARYLEAAQRAADFLLGTLRSAEGRLWRRYRDGEAAIPAFAEDYAYFSRGLLDLYQAGLEPKRLRQARDLARELVRLFSDSRQGDIFDTAQDAERLILRPKTLYDGALPAANSVALDVYSRLFLLTGDPSWNDEAQNLLRGVATAARRYPAGYTFLLQGADLLSAATRQVVVVGSAGAADTGEFMEVIRSTYAPELGVLFKETGKDSELAELAPFTAAMQPVDGQAAAYVCEHFACRRPLVDPAALQTLLQRPPPPAP